MAFFEKGRLWQNIVWTTERALENGALVPVPTDVAFIEDNGIQFFVRVLATLARKDEALKIQAASVKSGANHNPFLPPEKDLSVTDISDTHIAILNKYNVVEHHLLIVTRHYEDQDILLTLNDFEALWLCLAEYRSIGFYNGGKDAGASQRHKHLQLVPLPLSPRGPAIPIEPIIANERQTDGPLLTIPGFPFLHSFTRLRKELIHAPFAAARETFHIYASMLRRLSMSVPSDHGLVRQSMPYCLLVTREWMLLIPRSQECFGDISLNSLAFAGSLFVRNEQQLEQIRSYRPMNILRSVTIPP